MLRNLDCRLCVAYDISGRSTLCSYPYPSAFVDPDFRYDVESIARLLQAMDITRGVGAGSRFAGMLAQVGSDYIYDEHTPMKYHEDLFRMASKARIAFRMV